MSIKLSYYFMKLVLNANLVFAVKVCNNYTKLQPAVLQRARLFLSIAFCIVLQYVIKRYFHIEVAHLLRGSAKSLEKFS